MKAPFSRHRRKKRKGTGINGGKRKATGCFSSRTPAQTPYPPFSQYTPYLPSQTFACVPIPSALPLTKKKHRHLRTRDSEHFTEPSGSTSHLHAPAVLFTSSLLCRERFSARVLGVLGILRVLGERGQRKGCSQGLFPGYPGAKNSQSSQYSQNSQCSQFPSQSLACAPIPPALPGKTEGNRNQR